MSTKETLEKAYGGIPKEIGLYTQFDTVIAWRGVKYYWLKFIRKFTR
jgi:hypothetical protein